MISKVTCQQVELFRMYWRGMADRLAESQFQHKIPEMAYRGHLESTTPYSDWLFAQTMLFIIDIGYSGGRRSYSEYRLSEWNNFADVVFEGKDIGLWNVDAFVQKHTGSGRRAPYFILDKWDNEGVVQRWRLLKSRRGSDKTPGYKMMGAKDKQSE